MATVQDDRRSGAPVTSESRNEERRWSSTQTERTEKTVVRGMSVDVIASGAVVVLAILGLADVLPVYMAPVAVLALGAALLIKSGTIARRFPQFAGEFDGGGAAELAGGMTAELYAGVAGIALGVLTLIGIAPLTLMAVAVIVYGGAMLFGGGETYRISQFARPRQTALTEAAARYTAETAAAGESMVGIAAVVLGILALTGAAPMTLILVALLSLGGAAFLSAFASCSHAMTLLRR